LITCVHGLHYIGDKLALRSRLRAAGFAYNPRRHQITCVGRRDVRLPYAYLGADDSAGPGYTGQPAVTSYYTEAPCPCPPPFLSSPGGHLSATPNGRIWACCGC
jgi:hypothetical protein